MTLAKARPNKTFIVQASLTIVIIFLYRPQLMCLQGEVGWDLSSAYSSILSMQLSRIFFVSQSPVLTPLKLVET